MKKVSTKDMIRFDDYLAKQLKDPEFKEAYDALEFDYDLIQAILEYRNKHKLTSKQFAKKVGISLSTMLRIETASGNIGLAILKKVTKVLGIKLVLK
jgi:DNA-binding XRE family transcriptional regulator